MLQNTRTKFSRRLERSKYETSHSNFRNCDIERPDDRGLFVIAKFRNGDYKACSAGDDRRSKTSHACSTSITNHGSDAG